MEALIKILIVIILIILLIAVSAAAFIGAGYLLSLAIPLTLFQASVIAIGATFVFAFIIYALMIANASVERRRPDYYYEEEYDEEDEEEYDDDEYNEALADRLKKFKVIHTKKVGRNEPCPCGSGKKYKHCCGK